MYELIITLSDGRRMRRVLADRPQIIGRDAGCDITVDDPSASRRHARITPTAKGYVVEDLGSKNGTLVNDEPCTTRPLRDGDEILLGSVLAVLSQSRTHASTAVVISDDLPDSHATQYLSGDQRLNLSQQRLQMIYELSERLVTLQSQDQLLENAMDICFETLHFERGAIGIRPSAQGALDWPIVRNVRGAEGELTISRTLFGRALNHGERAIFTDAQAGNIDPTVSIVQQGIRSAMCVPLRHQGDTLGVIYGDRLSTSTAYSNEDIDFLAGIAQHVTIGLINCRLLEEQQKMVELQRDIDLARTIQTGLFPSDLPNHERFRAAAVNDPGQRVSGDYYDVIEMEDGRVWCLVADVTGEGVAASLLMANLQAAVRVTISESTDPGTLLKRWNQLTCRNTHSSKFITGVLVLIDPRTHRIEFATAGHCPPVLLRADGTAPQELTAESTFPLGVVEDAEFPTITVEAGPAPFALVCYTDGIIEAMNPKGEMYSAARLLEMLGERTDLNAQSLVKHIRKHVSTFVAGAPQSDDITILAAQVA